MKYSLLAFGVFVFCSSFNGPDVRLDGILSNNEWKNAKEASLQGSGKLYFMQKKNVLYVALKDVSKGWAHVYLSHNDTVRVMHASAALGAIDYIPQDGKWATTQKFNWQLRDRTYNDTTGQKLQDYYMKNGWAANNLNIGDGLTVEFKIDLSRFAGQKLAFAGLFVSNPAEPHYYPAELNDQTLFKDLVSGNAPAQLKFNSRNWHKLSK